jgi:XTP/dITP diphosphohydrolase
MEIVFATRNIGKITEMKAFLADLDVRVLSLDEVGIFEEIEEDGETFEENALGKAKFVALRIGKWAVADDSGICIKSLGNAPGVLTARWAGEDASDEKLVEYTLEQMKGVPEGERQAYFESAIALVSPDGKEYVFQGRVDGVVAKEPRGVNRVKLPYDLIFIPEGETRTFAEMSDVEKNSMSHRGRAFEKLREFLKKSSSLF